MKNSPFKIIRKLLAFLVLLVLFIFTLGPKALGLMTLIIIILIFIFGRIFILGLLLGIFITAFLRTLVPFKNNYNDYQRK
ncbi:MAG: hypothetical protein U5L76_03905 [Patescibacteria group bacterium]|nr:hypothetical protein [Patescibacteria group bacterium]